MTGMIESQITFLATTDLAATEYNFSLSVRRRFVAVPLLLCEKGA